MNCDETRQGLLDRARGRVSGPELTRMSEHLATCEECRRAEAADAQLSLLLDDHLPRPSAPRALRRDLERRYAPKSALTAARGARTWVPAAGALVAALALLIWQRNVGRDAMLAEAVNDHLRILYTEHPLDVESGGIHQVKPWFAGRLDFAPIVAFGGDDEFPLRGGASAYYLDRKAAAFIFKRHLHVMTLFVFRPEGLPWPVGLTRKVGASQASTLSSRGFHVLLWRSNDLGYALVSDVDEEQMLMLANKVENGG